MKEVFPRYRDKTLDDFETGDNPSLIEAVKVVRDYTSDLKSMMDQGMGIAFVGPNGVGKTHLACTVLHAVEDAGYRYECIELSTYISVNTEMFDLGARLQRIGQDSQYYEKWEDRHHELEERIRYIEMRAKFLLLDDLGRETESQSGWSNGRVFDLLRFRHNRGLPSIVTTNQPLDAIDARYTEGLSSFLHEATILVMMEGEDYRCVVDN